MMGSKSPRVAPVDNDALSRLPPAQLREMREAFQVLDRDNDGSINRDDVADVLLNLGTSSVGERKFAFSYSPEEISGDPS
jgi:Ca2+-binding EF-hand superfamily protein